MCSKEFFEYCSAVKVVNFRQNYAKLLLPCERVFVLVCLFLLEYIFDAD